LGIAGLEVSWPCFLMSFWRFTDQRVLSTPTKPWPSGSLWWFYIAVERGPFIADFKTESIISIAIWVYLRKYWVQCQPDISKCSKRHVWLFFGGAVSTVQKKGPPHINQPRCDFLISWPCIYICWGDLPQTCFNSLQDDVSPIDFPGFNFSASGGCLSKQMVMKLGVMNHTPRQKPTMWHTMALGMAASFCAQLAQNYFIHIPWFPMSPHIFPCLL
jgi:hypothetical protein